MWDGAVPIAKVCFGEFDFWKRVWSTKNCLRSNKCGGARVAVNTKITMDMRKKKTVEGGGVLGGGGEFAGVWVCEKGY